MRRGRLAPENNVMDEKYKKLEPPTIQSQTLTLRERERERERKTERKKKDTERKR